MKNLLLGMGFLLALQALAGTHENLLLRHPKTLFDFIIQAKVDDGVNTASWLNVGVVRKGFITFYWNGREHVALYDSNPIPQPKCNCEVYESGLGTFYLETDDNGRLSAKFSAVNPEVSAEPEEKACPAKYTGLPFVATVVSPSGSWGNSNGATKKQAYELALASCKKSSTSCKQVLYGPKYGCIGYFRVKGKKSYLYEGCTGREVRAKAIKGCAIDGCDEIDVTCIKSR